METTSTSAEDRFNLKRFCVDLTVDGIAAGISKTAVAPIERVKILLQFFYLGSERIQTNQRKQPIQRNFGCMISGAEGTRIHALWRGNCANVLRYFPMQAFTLAFRDAYKNIFLHGYAALCAACGQVAGVTTVFIVYPLDFARTRLAADVGRNHSREFHGIIDCFVKILKSDGLVGLYRGFIPAVQVALFYRTFYFVIFDTTRTIVSPFSSVNDKVLSHFLLTYPIAQMSTLISGLIVYPLDTARCRMTMLSGQRGIMKRQKPSMLNCLRGVIRNEGVRSLYNGVSANIHRSVGGALVLTTYEEIHKFLLRPTCE